ncbi:type II secretion protein F [Thermoanaerobacterium thermosaccharolyticum]|nr:type II secretion protein F [Thermoanaerobacterium thermosaccharolyticum]
MPLVAFLIYTAIKEYEIYRLKKRIYRIKPIDEISKLLGKAVNKSFLYRINEMLKAAGNPLKLTAETYIIAHLGLFSFAVIYIYLTKMVDLQAILLILLSIFGLDLYIQSVRKDRIEKFRREMPEIVDLFELGATADVPLEDIFLITAQSAKSKEVRNAITKLAAEYIMTREKEVALRKFANEVSLPEANVLAMALLQGDRTGRTVDILSTLSSSLFNTAASKVARQDKSMEYKVLSAIFFLMASIVTLYIYSYFTNIQSGLKMIF